MNWRRLAANVAYYMRSNGRGLEHAAIFVVASVMALNIVSVAGRAKPDDAVAVASREDLPAPMLAGDTTRPTSVERQKPRPRPAPRPLDTGALPAPLPANLFQPQKQILDATGKPAIDPHRGAPLPLKLDIVARADDRPASSEPAPEAVSVTERTGESATSVGPAEVGKDLAARRKRQGSGEVGQHRQRRHVAAIEELAEARAPKASRAKSRKPELAVDEQAPAKRAKPVAKAKAETAAAAEATAPKKVKSVVARSTQRNEPTPGELVMRTLRGA